MVKKKGACKERTDSAGQEVEVTWETAIEMVCVPCGEKSVMNARQIKEKIVLCDKCDKHCSIVHCEKCGEGGLTPSAYRHFDDRINGRCFSSPKGEDLRKADLVIYLACSGA